MATAEVVLTLLLPGPRHGYDIKRGYDEWFTGMRPLAFGQVYSTLSRLQRDELIKVAHTETADGPERVVYELTAAGRDRALAWLADPVEPGSAQADELIRKTISTYRLNADPAGFMARQRAAHLRSMRALEPPGGPATADPAALAARLLADHARLQFDADLRWLEIAAERIRAQPIPSTISLQVRPQPEPDSSNVEVHQ